MTMPGFDAEASLYRTLTLYSASRLLGQAGGAVRPQSGCDWTCVDDCSADCDDCWELPQGPLRTACYRGVQACNNRCERDCGCHGAL
jgi:hypothetical protein